VNTRVPGLDAAAFRQLTTPRMWDPLFTSMIGIGVAYAAMRKGPGGYWAIAPVRGPTMPPAVLCAQRGTTWAAVLVFGPNSPSTMISGPRGISVAASSLGTASRPPSRSIGSSAVMVTEAAGG
jgi:hypothetical protein